MTGFGAAQLEREGMTVRAEIRSVNHRHLQVRMRLPSSHHRLEPKLEAQIKKGLQRGSIQVHVNLDTTQAAPNVRVHSSLAKRYAETLRTLGEELDLGKELKAIDLANLPGVLQVEEAHSDPETEALWIQECLGLALEDLASMRLREGAAMVADVLQRADEIEVQRKEIAERSPQVVQEHKVKLQERVAALLQGSDTPNEKDLAREIALLSDRLDVSEEISRLEAHLDQLRSLLAAGGAVGRKLDFLAQEFMREANTIGSKCSDAQTAHEVVEMKTAIERMREQVQNVE